MWPDMSHADTSQSAAIGFRLAHELEGLLEGISADAIINAPEAERLRRWLEDCAPFSAVEPFRTFDAHLTRVLEDGVVTMEECHDLLFAVRKYTTANAHLDRLRGGIYMLTGLLTGVAADGVLCEMEIAALGSWTREWQDLRGLWPFDQVSAIVDAMMSEGRVTKHASYLFELARQCPVAGGAPGEAPPLLVRGLCASEPVINFPGRTFVFTGKMSEHERSNLQGLIASRGASFDEHVTMATDYLVICADKSPYWAFACYGRKIEQAHALAADGHRVLIVQEADFWKALATDAPPIA